MGLEPRRPACSPGSKHTLRGSQHLMRPLRGACSPHGDPPLKRPAVFILSLGDVGPATPVSVFCPDGSTHCTFERGAQTLTAAFHNRI